MAKKKAAKSCSCVEKVNEQLAKFNTRLERPMLLNLTTGESRCGLEIAAAKVNPKLRGRKKTVLATYCPFCGKYLRGDQ